MFWLLLACKEPEAAPRDLDTVVHDLWGHYFLEDDAALLLDTVDLRGLIDESALPTEGTFTDLTEEEAAAGGAPGLDPTPAAGFFTVGFVDCTPAEMEQILIAENQDELYPGNYTEYLREYSSDADAYATRDEHHLSWDATYSVSIFGMGDYTSTILGGAHFTPDGDDGPYLYSTTVMPDPAVTAPATVFDIDMQMEAFYPHEGGVVHFFGMWRNIVLDSGLGTDSDIGITLILDGLHGWDDDTTKICDEGRVPS